MNAVLPPTSRPSYQQLPSCQERPLTSFLPLPPAPSTAPSLPPPSHQQFPSSQERAQDVKAAVTHKQVEAREAAVEEGALQSCLVTGAT